MQVLKPDYYDEFNCIADKCPNSCCIGWRIPVDKKSFEKYRKLTGEYGDYVNKNLSRNRKDSTENEYGKIQLVDNRCAFLDKNNLCDLYARYGEDILCHTCTIYPRLIAEYGGELCEKRLTFSCPEVARLIVQHKDLISFVLEEEEVTEAEKSYMHFVKKDEELYKFLWDTRIFLIEIAQFRELPTWKRMFFINWATEKLQTLLATKKYKEVGEMIANLRQKVQNKEMINNLESIKISWSLKAVFIRKVLKLHSQQGGGVHSAFFDFIKDIIETYQAFGEDEERIPTEEKLFNEYFRPFEYVLENYIVDSLYHIVMENIWIENFTASVACTTIAYSILKHILFARWHKKTYLEETDLIEALYSFSRTVEHLPGFLKEIANDLNKEGYLSTAYLTILVK